MKYLVCCLLFSQSIKAVTFEIPISPHAIKKGFTQPGALHKFLYSAQFITVLSTVAVDIGSTEYVNAYRKRWTPSCNCYVQNISETDPLYLKTGTNELSQWRLIVFKSLIGVGIGYTPALVKKMTNDNPIVEGVLIGGFAALSADYIKAAAQNVSLAFQNQVYNKEVGH